MKMELKNFTILTVLALIGVGMAFAFVGLGVNGESSSKDVWMYQKHMPVAVPVGKLPMLTEEQRQVAIEIAKQNETVRQYLEQGYAMLGARSIFGNVSDGEAEIVGMHVSLRKNKEWIFASIDLDKKRVIEILRSSGEIGVLGIQEENETEIRIAIGGKDGKLIRVPEVRELTEEEREKASEVALSDPEVQNIINGNNYEMEIRPTGVIITNEAGEVETKFNGASVMFELEDGTIYFVHVDLEKGKVIRISPPLLPPPINK